jgi:Xaa-Pro aminopeptidase
VYSTRRKLLKNRVGSGLILLLSNDESPMNYRANTYPYRQESSFLYYVGLNSPGLAAVIDIDESRETLFGQDAGIEDIIWMGPQPLLKERSRKVSIAETLPFCKLEEVLRSALLSGRKIHFLPPYRPEKSILLEKVLGIRHDAVGLHASRELVSAVVTQRSIKNEEEIEQIERALAVTRSMYEMALEKTRPGIIEAEIAGHMEGTALARGMRMAFPPIVTIHGETLHNHQRGNTLKKGDMLLIDSGAESPMGYASDITRTLPVSGSFTLRQREIYEIVQRANEAAIQAVRPGVRYRDIHLLAATTITRGLMNLGLMRGTIDEAVKQGAHALFFPHGIGHMMGLDVHDMEDLGEAFVGYDRHTKRSDQFGLSSLRLARKLQPGFVMTVEPGIYFIPALIEQWEGEKRLSSFIRYSQVKKYLDFGGIRIEDNVLVTATGRRILGRPIPKKAEAVEAAATI